MSLFKRKWCIFLYLSLQDHFLTLQFIIKVLLVYQFHLHHFKLQHKNPPYSIIKLNIYFSGLKKKKNHNLSTTVLGPKVSSLVLQWS